MRLLTMGRLAANITGTLSMAFEVRVQYMIKVGSDSWKMRLTLATDSDDHALWHCLP
jgi:hypothetical protein